MICRRPVLKSRRLPWILTFLTGEPKGPTIFSSNFAPANRYYLEAIQSIREQRRINRVLPPADRAQISRMRFLDYISSELHHSKTPHRRASQLHHHLISFEASYYRLARRLFQYLCIRSPSLAVEHSETTLWRRSSRGVSLSRPRVMRRIHGSHRCCHASVCATTSSR